MEKNYTAPETELIEFEAGQDICQSSQELQFNNGLEWGGDC